VIYGPGALTTGNLTASAIADLARGRLPGIMGDGSRIWTYSFVEDVVEGHMLALSKGKPGEKYILGGNDATLEEFAKMAGAIANVRVPRLHIPYSVVKLAAFAEELAASMSHRDPKLTREVVEIYKHHWVFSSAKAIRELGYRITPFDKALTQTVLWVMTAIREGKIK
jgi:farnesol dehydrogenase